MMRFSAASLAVVEPITPLPAAQITDQSSSRASRMNRLRSESSTPTAASWFSHGTGSSVNFGPIARDTALPSSPPRPTIQVNTPSVRRAVEYVTGIAHDDVHRLAH